MTDIVDPTPMIEEQIAAQVGPLRAELAKTTDSKERKRLQREIRRRESEIRRSILGNRALW